MSAAAPRSVENTKLTEALHDHLIRKAAT